MSGVCEGGGAGEGGRAGGWLRLVNFVNYGTGERFLRVRGGCERVGVSKWGPPGSHRPQSFSIWNFYVLIGFFSSAGDCEGFPRVWGTERLSYPAIHRCHLAGHCTPIAFYFPFNIVLRTWNSTGRSVNNATCVVDDILLCHTVSL